MRRRQANRGSAILLAVGLVTILALLGASFMLIARNDRRQSRYIAAAAGNDHVGLAMALMVAAALGEDLYIENDTNGPYSAADTWAKRVDFPSDAAGLDAHLSTFAPFDDSGTDKWGHLTKLGVMPNDTKSGEFTDVEATDDRLTDTDGDGVPDAVMWPLGVYNIRGKQYWVAVRVIDASGLVNANTAYGPMAATLGHIIPEVSVTLQAVPGLDDINLAKTLHDGVSGSVEGRRGDSSLDVWTGTTTADWYSNYVRRPASPENPGSNYLQPFDMSDMLALAWHGSGDGVDRGRLYGLLGDEFLTARPFLTTLSASRTYIPQALPGDGGVTSFAQKVKVDLNMETTDPQVLFDTLFKAFYNAIPGDVNGHSRDAVAKQLAANVIDYRDADDDVFVYKNTAGVERMPFVTEAFVKRYRPAADPPATEDDIYCAIKLFNPYSTPISLSNIKITSSAASTNYGDWSGTIPAGGQFVIVSHSAEIPVTSSVKSVEVLGLDMADSGEVKIYRSDKADGSGTIDILIASIPVLPCQKPTIAEEGYTYTRLWDDNPSTARYTLDVSVDLDDIRDYTTDAVGGDSTAGNTKLGTINYESTDFSFPGIAEGDPQPCPPYVRNDKFISIGELNRIFYVGPGVGSAATESLRDKLQAITPTSVANGRLSPLNDAVMSGETPNVPVGTLLSNYFTVAGPAADGLDNDNDGNIDEEDEQWLPVYGRININTAPREVLNSLPALSSLSEVSRDKIVDAILAARVHDKDAPSYYLSPTHVALPIRTAGEGLANTGEKLPRNDYFTTTNINEPPRNYALGTDTNNDGIPDIDDNDGLAKTIQNDLIKYELYSTWLANCVTVRSDVYIAYIRVQAQDPEDTKAKVNQSDGVQSFVAVIDRSNCRTTTDRPTIRMFAQVR